MLVALHGHLEAEFHDALNLRTGVDISIVGHIVVLMALAEVHTTREFAQYHEVGTTNEFILQGRLMQQAVERGHRAHVGKKAQLLTHSQQTYLWTDLRCRIVIVFQIAHSSEEYGVGLHTYLVGGVRIGIAHLVDGVCTTNSGGVSKLVAKLLGNCIEHSHTLFHNLRTNSIAL